MIEIERKFLVSSGDYKKHAVEKFKMVQGFLNTHPERTVRVRILDDRGYLTVKGKSNKAGTIRKEWETEIPLKEAEMLLELCEETQIEKYRYNIPFGKHLFEVDEFLGENKGLVVAEIELNSEAEAFERPEWLGTEVTGDLKYYNSNLSRHPYKKW